MKNARLKCDCELWDNVSAESLSGNKFGNVGANVVCLGQSFLRSAHKYEKVELICDGQKVQVWVAAINVEYV